MIVANEEGSSQEPEPDSGYCLMAVGSNELKVIWRKGHEKDSRCAKRGAGEQ